MEKFKIRARVADRYFSSYLGEEKVFEFMGQTSDGKKVFTLFPNTQVELDFAAVRDAKPIAGDYMEVEGVFYNFTKQSVPEMVFCVTKILAQR